MSANELRLTGCVAFSLRPSVLAIAALLSGVCCAVPSAWAGEFAGLVPGRSTRAEVDRTLGMPVREVRARQQYDYDPARYDATRISVQFAPDGSVASIDLYPRKAYAKASYKRWFELEGPASTTHDASGHLVEHYLPAGIALHYRGADDQAPVEYFSHFDLRLLTGREQTATTTPTAAYVDVSRPTAAQSPATHFPPSRPESTPAAASLTTSHLGVKVSRYAGSGVKLSDVNPASPAARAGLQPGDVLIELGSAGFHESAIEPWRFMVYVAGLPPGRPLPLLVRRGNRELKLQITPEARVLDAAGARELAQAFGHSGLWRRETRDLAGAAEQFERAIAIEPTEPAHYAALASVARVQQNATAEQAVLQRGIHATQSYRLYWLLGSSYREAGRYPEAIDALKRAIDLAPVDVRDARIYSELGYCLFRMQRCSEAIPALEEARRRDATLPPAAYFLARCHDALQHPEQAVRHYRAFLDLHATGAPAEWGRLARERVNALAPR